MIIDRHPKVDGEEIEFRRQIVLLNTERFSFRTVFLLVTDKFCASISLKTIRFQIRRHGLPTELIRAVE